MPSPVYNNFQNLITFSRASNATLVDATGRITYAPNNLVLQSQTFDNASWAKTNTLITADATTAPDGTATADKLTSNNATGGYLFAQSASATAGVTYVGSVYLKAAELGFAFLVLANSAFTTAGISVNLSTGAVSTAIGSPLNAQSVNAGNGWWRVSFSLAAIVTTNGSINVYLTNDGVWANRAAAITVGNGIFVWGAQLEAVTYQTTPSTYNPTTTAAYYGPRLDYDPATLALKGLLVEEARTNFLTYSEQFNNAAWTAQGMLAFGSGSTINATTSPDGTVTADLLTEDTSSGEHRVYQAYAGFVNATGYTFSAYLKPNGRTLVQLFLATGANTGSVTFDLSNGTIGTTTAGTGTISSVGNGWYRCTVTFTSGATTSANVQIRFVSTGTTTNYTGNGTSGIYLWGAQLEAGFFATSYIPTVAASVARSADLASMSGSQFAPWYNRNAGTFVVGFTPDVGLASGARVISTTSGGVADRVIDINYLGVNWVNYNGTTSVAIGAATLTTTLQRISAAYQTANYGYALNGATPVADATVLVNSPTELRVGNISSGNLLNGHIQTITYYPRRLSNSQLQSLTS